MGSKTDKVSRTRAAAQHLAHEAEGGGAGALAGAIVGAAAGPPGIVAGAIIGGIAGTVAGAVLDAESLRQAARTGELDSQIGVMDGEIGAPNLEHPPAKVGAYSGASSGVSAPSEGAPAEGPMQPPEG
jgi:hypothetical protein